MFRTFSQFSFFIVFLLLCHQTHTLYYLTALGTQNRLKAKILHMDEELVKDVMMKVKAVRWFKDRYYKSKAFQVGEVTNVIQSEFKTMDTLYTIQQWNITYGEGNWYEQGDHIERSIQRLVLMERSASEVHLMIEGVEDFESETDNKEDIHTRMKYMRSRIHEDESFQQQRDFYTNLMSNRRQKEKKRKNQKWSYGGEYGPGSPKKMIYKPTM